MGSHLSPPADPVRIVRVSAVDDDTLTLLHEYYEAIQVVQRDTPEAIQALLATLDSGIWLAYLGAEPVGCVVLRSLPAIPAAAECKRLYVRPSARGRHIADRLLDAQENYARSRGLHWIYLDSHDGLQAALALYGRRGYSPCERYNNNPQATIFMRKSLQPSG